MRSTLSAGKHNTPPTDPFYPNLREFLEHGCLPEASTIHTTSDFSDCIGSVSPDAKVATNMRLIPM